jgi:F0F1-type ATP synthase membrane subunit b/b'
MERSSHTIQMLGSLLVAVAIVALTVVAVTAKLGPTSAAELDARDERLKQRLEQREEAREQRQDLREERLKRNR